MLRAGLRPRVVTMPEDSGAAERAAVATDDNSRAAVAPDDNSTYNQPELRRDDDAADHLAAVVAAKAIAVLAAVSPQRE